MIWRKRLGGGVRRLLLAMLASGAAVSSAPAADIGTVCNQAEVDALLERSAGQRTTVIDKTTFYKLAKATFSIYDKPGNHYTGTDSLLDYWNTHRELTDLRWLAYIMGTSYHETARRMFPVRETLASSDAAVVKILARSSHTKNKTYWKQDGETGQHYYGRGHVQLTWRSNYELADRRLSRDPDGDRPRSFLWNADLALDPKDSVEILFDGMVYGWYTQKHCLPYYFDPAGQRREDWKNARRIVNVLDRWQTIADHARNFLTILRQSEVTQVAVIEPKSQDVPDVTEEEEQPPTAEELLEIAEERVVALGEENTKLNAQVASLKADAGEQAAEINALRQAREADRQRIEALEAQLASVAATVSGLEQRNAEMAERLEASLADQRRLADEAAAAAQRLEQANVTLEAARTELGAARAELSVVEARNTTLSNRVDVLTVEEQRLRLRLQEAEGTLRALQEQADKSWWSGWFEG